MTDIKLEGHKRFGILSRMPIEVRKVNSDVHPLQLEVALNDNQLDELVVQTPKGDRYILMADELKVTNSQLPAIGDEIKWRDIEGQVIHVNNEVNEELVALGVAAAATVVRLAFTKMDHGGVDADIMYNGINYLSGDIVKGFKKGVADDGKQRLSNAIGGLAGVFFEPKPLQPFKTSFSIKEHTHAIDKISTKVSKPGLAQLLESKFFSRQP